MPAIDALRTGDLAQALADLQNDVRSSPDDPRHRVFLFQLLAVLGNWDRATGAARCRQLARSRRPRDGADLRIRPPMRGLSAKAFSPANERRRFLATPSLGSPN